MAINNHRFFARRGPTTPRLTVSWGNSARCFNLHRAGKVWRRGASSVHPRTKRKRCCGVSETPQVHFMSDSKAQVLSTEPLSNDDARWIKLTKTTYHDPNGKERTWESAERRTRPSESDIDGVGIVAILDKPLGKEIILQKQYRPPINKIVIEVPAGLIDDGETPEQAAVRELREETGYVGIPFQTTPIMFNDPGFCNTNLRMIHVTVDMSLLENQDPKPQLEEEEFIEVFTVPLDGLWDACRKFEVEGYAIDARVGTLAEGILLAQQLK